jgi:thiamine biosynthesis protein ThiS
MPRLRVNGETMVFDDGAFPGTVANLVVSLKLDARSLVAEVNGGIVPRESFGDVSLADGDRVELVQFVGGG